jgi:UDP-N-acetylglucosamine acyltransferase
MHVPGGGYRLVDGAWIHPRSKIAAGVVIEPGAVVGAEVEIGKGSWIGAGAVLYGPTVLGEENQVGPTAVLGGAPQDPDYRGEPTRLVIGHRNVFREGFTANRGSARGEGATVIGSDNHFMARSHIGHDCVVGDHVVLAADVDLVGPCRFGSPANLDGTAAIVRFSSGEPFAFIGCLVGTSRDHEPTVLGDGAIGHSPEINITGILRGKFDYKTVNSLKEAYRVLVGDFQKGRTLDLDQARSEIERRGVLCEEVEELLGLLKAR